MRRVLLAALLALFFVPGIPRAQAREAPLAEGRRMLAVQGGRYGTLATDHPVTLKIRGVFQNIVRAAGRHPGGRLEVHVLDTLGVVAEAPPGGLVVVVSGQIVLAGRS